MKKLFYVIAYEMPNFDWTNEDAEPFLYYEEEKLFSLYELNDYISLLAKQKATNIHII